MNNQDLYERIKKKKCSFEGCKFKSQKNEDFCGKHLKIGKKIQNPDIYCTKKNCCNLKKMKSTKFYLFP